MQFVSLRTLQNALRDSFRVPVYIRVRRNGNQPIVYAMQHQDPTTQQTTRDQRKTFLILQAHICCPLPFLMVRCGPLQYLVPPPDYVHSTAT